MFNPNNDVYRRGINPLKLIDELRQLGESVCIPDVTDIRSLESINPEEYSEGWNIFLNTSADENAIRDFF